MLTAAAKKKVAQQVKSRKQCEPSSKAQDARDCSGRRPWRAQCGAIKKNHPLSKKTTQKGIARRG